MMLILCIFIISINQVRQNIHTQKNGSSFVGLEKIYRIEMGRWENTSNLMLENISYITKIELAFIRFKKVKFFVFEN